MQLTYLRSFLLAWLLLLGSQLWGQTELWSPIAEDQIPKSGTRYIFAEQYQTVRLNLDEIRAILDVAPMERTPIAAMSQTLLSLPMPDGSYEVFDIVESPIMETELAEKFPEIQTYAGRSINDPSKSLRFDLTPQGFHAIILTAGKGTIYIDPYQFGGGDIEHYIVYNRRDFRPAAPKQFVCGLTGNNIPLSNFKAAGQTAARFGSCELRTYRMAVAATGEYTQFQWGTVALALAAQTTTINRVNSVYEREMAIRMNLVANNNLIIYTNATTDPYTNGAPGTMITENQANIDTEIGSANYDIGHVFGTNSGGLAGLGVVCSNSGKARGVTGSAAPIGDPFDIDYVAHEVGHQFGCNHTQNNNCNRNNATATEPGSASTIMGYAGICAPNVQNQSDDYFHSISLEEMGAFITGAGHNCPATTALANNAPTVNAPAANINIPANTPFSLTASATDPDGNSLTYSWEQMENATATMPPVASSTAGPNFRSFDPVTDPTRYFPNLVDLAAGGPFTWEVLPSVSRVMDFRVTVRDNAAGGGCTDHADMQVTVDASSGPFVVLYPSASGISWNGGGTETVTWDVAGTDGSPVSCANVDILLSTDGGLTYPTVLASNVPNDGTEPISVPNVGTTTGRIMVRCANGYFFDISDNDFTIVLATNDYTLSTTNNSQSVCAAATPSYSIDVGQIGSYSDPVTLSLSGLPTGVVGNFSINPVTPASSSTLSLNVSGATAAGSYPFTVNASSTSGNKSLALTLVVNDPTPTAVTLNSPANGATAVALPVNFDWSAAAGANSYTISIATDAAFTNVVDQATGLSSPNYTSNVLGTGTQYFWEVIAINSCGSSPAAGASFSSGLQACDTISNYDVANDNPALYNAGGPGGYLAGHNGYGDIAKADYFNYGGANTHLTGAYFGFGQAVAANASNSFNVQVWDGTGGTPGAVIASIPIAYQDIVTLIAGGNNVAFVPFGNIALPASNEFFVGIEYTYGSDTIALITNTDGETSPATAWEQWGDGTWHAYDATGSWGIDVAHYIVPVLGTLPSANFSPNNSTICLGSSITFNNSSTDADSYEWFFPGGSPASSTAMNPSVSYNTAGTYDVALVATNDCISDTLIVLSAITVSEVVTGIGSSDESCAGNDGTATVSATSGTAPYTFLWSDGQTTATATNLVAGTYTVTATDANGCTTVATAVVNNSCTPCTLAATTSATDASCNASNDGSATAIATAGTTPYSFLWSDGQTTATATNLVAGTYTVTATDAAGCATTSTAVVNEPTALLASASSSDETCAGNDGTATATISGGTAGYTFLWSDGQTTATATNLVAGTYTVTITDANGCTTVATAVVNNSCTPCTLAATTSATDASCNASNDGSATAIATAGTTPYSFLWSDGQTTATATNLIAGTYTVTVTDAAGCATTSTAVVNEPTALLASASSSDETCAGNDGTATATISGGTAGYTFLWSDGQTTATASNLVAGTYTLTITDANGCTTVATAVVNNSCTPCTLAATTSATDASCNASNDGSATAIATAGTTPYSFLWSDGQTTATATNLIAGTYTVTVTDAAGCTLIATAVVNEPTALLASASSSDETCAGNDGTATATISGGTAGYTFLWSDGQTTATASNLVAGTYTVTITDANGCTTVATAVVNNSCTPCTLAATTSATDASCNASNDGSATAIATAGTTPYSFLWSDGQTTATATNLIAGTYTVTVTDAAGCTTTSTAVVNEPTALVASASSSDETCAGNDGTATATISGGTAGYTFLWSDGQTTATASNLVAGTYTLTITDANGCTTVATAVVNNSCTPCTLAATTSATDASCNASNDGSATVIATAGTTPYSFLWSDGQTTATATNLIAGTYTVTVTDAAGCTTTSTAVVNEPTALVASASSSDETCAGNDGTATATISGGTAGYTFLWSDGQTTATATNLIAGTYTVTITDANGCTTVATAVVNYNCPCNGSLQLTPTDVSCASNCNGSISLQSSGLQAPISYRWTNGATVANPINLCGGNYSVTATDANGCVAVASTTVAQPTAVTLATGINNESCAGNDGNLTAIVNGGTTPYTFAWSNGANTSSLTALAAGVYQLTVTDANACDLTAAYTVALDNSLATNAVASQNASCAGYADGEAQAVGTGTGLPINYSWSNGANTQVASGLAAGNYTVTISSGVCSAQRSVQVTEPAAMQIQLMSTEQNCVPGTGALALNVSGGGGAPYSYLWSNGATTANVSNLANGNYSVTITSANGCEEQRSASFNIPQGPVLSSLSSSPNCSNTADGSLDLTVSPAGNYLYSWSNGANTEDLQGLAGGIYQVSVTDTAQGCTVVLSDTVNAPASLQVAFSVTQPHTPTSNNGALAASENGGTAPFSYLWSTGDSVSQLTNVGVGSYSVTVTDANGCTATDSIFVSAVTGINVQWAEAFSLFPNPSNGQMQLELVLQQSQQLELAIFDVLGRQLYQQRLSGQQFSLPLSFDWPAGTYFLRLSSPEGQISQKFVIRR